MQDFNQRSLELHEKYHGKLEIKSKFPLESQDDLSTAYTPGVAEISRVIGQDKSLVKKYTIKKNMVAIVSDGSAILGLGNLGPEAALPVMEGKAILFKEFANVDAFPICLDTQDAEEIIKTVKYLAPVFGGINLEDISAPRCFEIENRLAGLINALQLKNTNKEEMKVVMNGAGAAGVAVTKLLLKYGFKNIIICDSKGIIFKDRENLTPVKQELTQITNLENKQGGLAEAMAGADIFIGVSVADLVTEEMVKSMNERPVIFAMANPNPEIMPDKAKNAGVFIIATGRSDFPNQVNNVLAFPGIFRGALDNNVSQITDEMKISAAEALAGYVTDLNVDKILPSPLDKGVASVIAEVIR